MKQENSEVQDVDNLVEDFSSADKDDCPIKVINSHFTHRFIEVEQLKLSKREKTCSSLLADNQLNSIASVLSDKTVVVINKECFKIDISFKSHEKDITDIRFSPQNSNVLYTSSLDGTINLWDVRSNKNERTIEMNTDKKMPLTSFDVAQHEKLICAGTELVGNDSFILFWDLRGSKSLGGYWRSHANDISYVRFNPDNKETLATAGSDGLINVFDVSQSSEDDALMYSLNTEDVVNSFCWRNENRKSNLLAFTDVHSIQLWDIEDGTPSHTFSRESITKALRRNVSYECYSVPLCVSKFNKNPIILAGSGLEHENSSCLRTLQVNEKSGCLEPHGLLVSKDDKVSSITQVATFSLDYQDLITVREDGILSLWKEKITTEPTLKSGKSKKSNKKIKPY